MRSIARFMLPVLLAACACGDDAGEPGPRGDAGRDAGADGRFDSGSEPDAGAGTDGGPAADCSDEVPSFEDVEIFATCRRCHASELEGEDRNAAPAGADFDDYDSAASLAALAVQYVSLGSMPPPASGITVTATEKQQFYQWALCGTPE